MEHVKALLQYVVRSFYDTRHVIVLDAILRHNVISDDDLPQMVGVQKKELHKICAKLRDDYLISLHSRAEPKDGQQRPAQKTYYYIQYRIAVDAVKWRIHKLLETFNDQMRNDVDKQGYVCSYCKRRYTALEALPLQAMDLSGFVCADCGNLLNDDDDVDELRITQERLSTFMSQIRRIVDTLKRIDDTYIPDNDFDTALKQALPTSSDTKDVPDTVGYAAKGTNTTTVSIEVDLSEGDKDKLAAAAANAKLETAQQNTLPVWYQKSTIGRENSSAEDEEAPDIKPSLKDTGIKTEENGTKVKSEAAAVQTNAEGDADPEDVIAAYYRSLQTANDEEEEEEDEDEEEDEEDEFGEMETF